MPRPPDRDYPHFNKKKMMVLGLAIILLLLFTALLLVSGAISVAP